MTAARVWAWVTLGVFGLITILGNATEAVIADPGTLALGPIVAAVVNSVPAIALLMTTHLAAISVFHENAQLTILRRLLAAALGLLAIVALYMSWGALYDMAVHVGGMPHERALGFPFIVDLVTVVALLLSLLMPKRAKAVAESTIVAPRARRASGPRVERSGDRERVLALLEKGDMTLSEIAAETNVPKSTVARWSKPAPADELEDAA